MGLLSGLVEGVVNLVFSDDDWGHIKDAFADPGGDIQANRLEGESRTEQDPE